MSSAARMLMFPRESDADAAPAIREVCAGVFIADYQTITTASSAVESINPVVTVAVGQEFAMLVKDLPQSIRQPRGRTGAFHIATKLLEEDEKLLVDDDCKEPEGTPQEEIDVKSLEDLDEAAHVLEKQMGDCSACWTAGSNAIVFCYSGLNKSVTVVLAFLMCYRGYSLRDAFEHVWSTCPGAWPSLHMMKLLAAYEASLFRNVLADMQQQDAGGEKMSLPTLSLGEYRMKSADAFLLLAPVFAAEKRFRSEVLHQAKT